MKTALKPSVSRFAAKELVGEEINSNTQLEVYYNVMSSQQSCSLRHELRGLCYSSNRYYDTSPRSACHYTAPAHQLLIYRTPSSM